MVMKRCLLSFVFVISALPALTQNLVIQGVVKDNTSKRPLSGANILIKGTDVGVSSDSLGNYKLFVPPGLCTLVVSYVGYKTKEVKTSIERNKQVNLLLEEVDNVLEEVLIVSDAPDHNYNSTDIGINKIGIGTIKKMPSFMGERDILKSILLLPGVTSVGEGTSGINVRGGNADQNLILMDDAPLFNTSHLMGFLSVFNADVVDYFTFYKGGIPSRFGGRISSIFDTKLKAPNAEKWQLEGGIGMIANRLLIEGPIVSDKISFYLAGRLSYPDYLFKLSNNPNVKSTKANFYDLTTKIEYRINDKNRITFTGYRSNDNFKLSGDSLSSLEINASSSLFNWQTNNATLIWNKQVNEKVNFRMTAVQSLYDSKMSNPDSLTAYQLTSSINYQNIKAEVDFFPNAKNEFNVGLTGIYYRIMPGTLTPTSNVSSVNYLEIPPDQGLESAVFFNHEWKGSEKFSIVYGLRYSSYSSRGEQYVYTYQPDSPRNEETIIDSTFYNQGEDVKRYSGFEPRLSAKYSLNANSSIKIGYNRMYQYIQQISNTTAALPTDRWQLSTPYIKPQMADQLSAGYFLNLKNNLYETSFEVYYKDIRNATDYKDGVNLLLNPIPETAILQGRGKAYGMEFFIRKNKGKLTGWTSYTYSQTYLKIDGAYPEEKINNGDWYPSNFNKPHMLNLVVSYRAKPRINYSANFTYSTGRPVTYPEDKYLVRGTYIPNYVGRNTERIPDYHRLDVSMTVDEKPSTTRKWKSSWVFSIYNLYARQNAYSIFFKTKNDNYALYLKKANAYKLSVFGTIFPSVTYNFKF
jgi:ferric enterobactin receptor